MEFESFVLAAVTADLSEEEVARSDADAVEFRLDLADAPLDQLAAYDGELPLIATNRTESEGGGAPDGPGRLEALESAVDHPSVEAVDVELAALQAGGVDRAVGAARDHDVAVVVSAHDFEGTPPIETMRSTLETAAEIGDVGKLAVTASAPGDVLDLLALTWRLTDEGLTVATMAMGAAGRHSRAVAPIYGSRIGYAPVDSDRATAPGQYDLETLRTLVDRLGDR